MTIPTTPIDAMPPLPASTNRFDIGISKTGERMDYTRTQMHTYAQAHAAQRCAELEKRVTELTELLEEARLEMLEAVSRFDE